MSTTVTFEELAATIRDLDSYIERRAEELANPLIAEAAAEAAGRVRAEQDLLAEARAEILRQKDLVTELRRVAAARDRVAERWRAEAQGQSAGENLIIPWREVREDDHPLHNGRMIRVTGATPADDGMQVAVSFGDEADFGRFMAAALVAVRRRVVETVAERKAPRV